MNSAMAIFFTFIKNYMNNTDKLKAIVSYENIVPSPAFKHVQIGSPTQRPVLHRRTHTLRSEKNKGEHTHPNTQGGTRGRDTGGTNQDR